MTEHGLYNVSLAGELVTSSTVSTVYNYLRPSNGVPVAMNGRGEDMMAGTDGKIPSLTTLSLGMNDPGRQSQDAGRYPPPRPSQPYLQSTSTTLSEQKHGRSTRSNGFTDNERSCVSKPQDYGHPMNGKSGVPTAMPREVEILAKAGPLGDCGPLTQERPLGPEDVFARLWKQYPTNLHEADKRELDRITYEPDLKAPNGKPLKKVVDLNCGSGEWVILRDVKNQEGAFDQVHQRLSAFRTEIQEWTTQFAELGRLTRPDGWIQLAECNDIIVRAGVESLKVEKAALSSGLSPTQMVEALMPTILGAGLSNVECYEYGIPLDDWAGRRGNLAMRTYLSWVESLR
ncbi:hypothetical protein BGX34_003739 [Mortierella sp. NVP85]|nr:hypothetical protein BGX34_003739 [Mortierella sp. NVP85]